MKAILLIGLTLISLVIGGVFYFSNRPAEQRQTPAQQKPLSDLIKVKNPIANQLISSPLTIEGEARGYWYFEASFPVQILDANRRPIANHYAQALGEWMTEEFVPFRSVVEFQPPATNAGFLVLHKDNPSGLPEHDRSIEIPIRFR